MADPLDLLLNSSARVKLLRLFLFNPTASYTSAEAAMRARTSKQEARRELTLFLRAGLLRRSRRGRSLRFGLRRDFAYLQALQALLLNAPARGEDIVHRLRGAGGSIKFVALAGIFVGNWDGTLDLLVVGDRVSERKFKSRIKRLEAELGRELRYALLSSEDFHYRLNMNDKLLRDVIDYNHRIAFDRLNTGLT
jgi:hypothetical protein